jgi:hypothetical protein
LSEAYWLLYTRCFPGSWHITATIRNATVT